MKLRTWLQMAGLGAILALTGCIPSLHPLYTDADLTFDPALTGTWTRQDSTETWLVTKTGEKEYLLVYTDENGKKGEFSLHLLKAEGMLYADLYPVEPSMKENEYYVGHLMRVHTFYRVRQIEPTLQIAGLKLEWLKDHLQQHPDALKHEKVDDGILLTAQPKEMQAFLAKQEKTADAWAEIPPMTKKVEKPKP